jgi:hypothetical protein
MQHMAMPSPTGAPFRPGFLMEPLGWLTQRLAAGLESDPELLTAIFELDAYHMHGLGLGFAHCDPEGLSPSAVKALTHGPPQTVLKQILGRWPQGLDRVLRALPATGVLAPESYRALLAVLHDKASAAHLHHCRAITEPLIVALAALPTPLRRPAIFKLFDEIDGMDRFVAGLHFLCDRAGLTFDRFVEVLGALDQTEQVRAKITGLAEALPLPDRLPSQRLGPFRRVDDPAQIRSLAKSWHNCLGEYLHEVNEGTSLIYCSTEDEQPTAALLARANRLGWALVDIKGPKNIDIDPKTASRHHETFARAGIPRLADIAAIRSLLWRRHLSRR